MTKIANRVHKPFLLEFFLSFLPFNVNILPLSPKTTLLQGLNHPYACIFLYCLTISRGEKIPVFLFKDFGHDYILSRIFFFFFFRVLIRNLKHSTFSVSFGNKISLEWKNRVTYSVSIRQCNVLSSTL